MTLGKRLFDIAFALFLALILWPVMLLVALVILLRDGRPILYFSRRMRTPKEEFYLVKFRTMTPTEKDRGVTGGEKAWRITRLGRILRRTRLDEIPQLWNVLKGDVSFVGPRPPDSEYVLRLPELYEEVLKSRPGVTGLASLIYHAHEETLLSRCSSPEETDRVYAGNCAPRKARLDLIYSAHQSFCFDIWILWHTLLNRLSSRYSASWRGRSSMRQR